MFAVCFAHPTIWCLRFVRLPVSSDWISPLDQAHEYRDHREDEQNVNESSQSVRTDHSQQPKDQEQGDDSPKHGVILSDKGAARRLTSYQATKDSVVGESSEVLNSCRDGLYERGREIDEVAQR
jgi:hypothetical protein